MRQLRFLTAFVATSGLLLWAATSKPPAVVPIYGYQVVNTFPHDQDAYTQGLVIHEGVLYESTGLRGESTLRRVDLQSGNLLQKKELEEEYFAEGLTWLNNSLVQLTWRDQTGFVYDPLTFDQRRTFSYETEGWGLTSDGKSLIMSDGSETLYFLDPLTFAEQRRIVVRDRGVAVPMLNELEFVKGEIFANIYQSDRIARISPKTGDIVGWIDLTGILSEADRAGTVDVLNGIAYDSMHDRLYVTGKLWPRLFEIKLVKTGVQTTPFNVNRAPRLAMFRLPFGMSELM